MTSHILHFTLGPVQSFVAEARRTRDLWAGSFLLSWLSAHAMRGVEAAGPDHEIVFPKVDDDKLMQALRSDGIAGGNPYIGSVPNRFKARVPKAFDVTSCTNRVQAKWRDLANAVWREFVADAAKVGSGTETIWHRQIESFWDMAWVMAPDPVDRSDGAWLDQRKNWRTHVPSTEGGDHCQLMGQYQELSGYVRSRGKGERQQQDDFWRTMQERVGKLNLRDRERLSAIALVKRLFMCLPEKSLRDAIGWVPGEGAFNVKNWPSVSYIAAAPWLDAAWTLDQDACKAFHRQVKAEAVGGIYGETDTRLLGTQAPYSSEPFFKLDGHFFHSDAIRSMEPEQFRSAQGDVTDQQPEDRRGRTLKGLTDLCDAIAKARKTPAPVPAEESAKSARLPPFRASEFYAVLLCDGDHIGKNLRTLDGEAAAKKGLAAFTQGVPAIVERHHGVTIYAGGDDVLALLPLDGAIQAARAIRAEYGSSFGDKPQWTLSASIVFAQYHIPLRAVLAEAHHQLDAVAKEQNGRGSLAMSVLKPGGRAFAWVSAWQGPDPAGNFEPPHILDHLARDLQQNREFTTGFFYNVRERYEPLFEGKDVVIADYLVEHRMQKFLEAEYRTSGGGGDSETRVKELMRVALPFKRQDGATLRSGQFSFDAGLLIRFIAQEGRWFMTP